MTYDLLAGVRFLMAHGGGGAGSVGGAVVLLILGIVI